MSRKWINIIKTVSALLWLYLISIQIRQSMHQIDFDQVGFFQIYDRLIVGIDIGPDQLVFWRPFDGKL